MAKRTIWIAVGGVMVLVVGAGLAYTLRRNGPQPLAVQVEAAARRQVVQTVSATGRIQPKTEVKISADVSAKITRLGAAEGQLVEQGTLLVELDGERYRAALESAEANLRVANSNANVTRENEARAEKDLVRIRDLHTKGLETQAALDAAVATFQAERARNKAALDQVEQVRAVLKQAKDDLSKTRIYAPITGTISRRNKEVGEIALGSQFQEDVIMVLSNLGGMEALVQVDENDIVSLQLGDVAQVEVDALPGTKFAGRVSEIASSATVSGQNTAEQKSEFEVKVAIDQPGTLLRPGMTATAEITTEVHDGVIAVPIQSVAVRTPEQLGGEPSRWTPDEDGFVAVVFVIDGTQVRARPVKTGIQSNSHIEILEGLAGEERVVSGNYRAISRELTDGAPITLEAAAAAPPQG